MPGVDHDAVGRRGRFPGEVERDWIGQTAVGKDAAQAVRRLIDDVAGVAFPARRLGLVVGNRPGRTDRAAPLVDVD